MAVSPAASIIPSRGRRCGALERGEPWHKDRVRPIDDGRDPSDRRAALELALQWGEEIPIGILYKSGRPRLESHSAALRNGTMTSQSEAMGA